MLNKTTFDAIANTYDSDFTNSVIGKAQRKKVYQILSAQLKEKKTLNILEINCGTGEDAIWLAKQGHNVVATDISAEMITIAKQKQTTLNAYNNLSFDVCGFSDLANKYGNQQFDLIFSNFAGLNCINTNELSNLNKHFAQLLKPNGQLILVLLGKYCLLERLYFMFRFDLKKKNRRTKKASAYLSDNNYHDTWYYSYQTIEAVFSQFQMKFKKPIGLFIPPSYLENKMKAMPFIFKILLLLDAAFGNISMLANHADHLIIQLEKKQ